MGSYPDVVEISSEEEDGSNNKNKNNNPCLKSHLNEREDELDWLDDIIIMDELSDPAVAVKKKTSVPVRLSASDDDDDCQVLDLDPDKPVAVVSAGKIDESNEIEIVGEKGQIACRDFPHPRHLCANFPFDTTSHDKYCKMCHCYVCDSLAPCTSWGNLVDLDSHCHATDKIPMWKKLRDSNKAPFLHKTTLQNVTSCVMPTWRPVPRKSYAPNLDPISRPVPVQIPSPRSSTIGPITTGSMRDHRSRPYPPTRSRQLTRSSSMHVNSCDMFKQAGQPGYPVSNAHRTQPGPMLNQSRSTSNESLLRCLNAVRNNSLQRSQSQSGASIEAATSTTIPVLPQTQMGIDGNISDVATKSWQDILASVASELGVSDYAARTAVVQQPISTTSLPAQSVSFDNTGVENMSTHAQKTDSTMEHNTAGLDLNGVSGNAHANTQDIFEIVVSSPLYGFEENWMD